MSKMMFQDFRSLEDVFHKLSHLLNARQKRWAIVVFLATVFGSVMEMLGVSIIIPLVQAFVAPENIWENAFFRVIASRLGIRSASGMLILIACAVIFIYIVKNLYLIILSYLRVRFAAWIRRELSVKIIRSYMDRGYQFFINNNTATLIRGSGHDINGVYDVLYQFFKILGEALTAGCICGFMLFRDVQMTLGVVCLLGGALMILVWGFRRIMRKCGEDFRRCTAITGRYLNETLQGAKEVLVFRKENYFINQYEKAYGEQQKVEVVKTVASESPAYLIEAVCVSGLIIVVCLKQLSGTDSSNFVTELATFAVAAFRILPSIGRISGCFNQFIYSVPSLNATYENILEVERYEKKKRDCKVDRDIALPFCNEISIRSLTWRYTEKGKNVLKDLNLTIKKGTSVAFIGQSGAGKSTLVDVLMGLLIPEEGDIYVDGISIYDNIEKWKEHIGYVPQTVFLEDDTIRKNIAFGIPEDEIKEDKVRSAAEQAQLLPMIQELPDGWNTIMGERGVRFSGGQKQRVAIARALYNDPDIVVLDEATAALDNETESALMDAIELLHGKKTLIIVAHRLTTVRKCDYIYEIEEGRIVQREKEDIFNEVTQEM